MSSGGYSFVVKTVQSTASEEGEGADLEGVVGRERDAGGQNARDAGGREDER